MTPIHLALLAAIANPSAEQSLSRLGDVQGSAAPACDVTVSVETEEDGDTVRRAYRYDASERTSLQIEGPAEEMEAAAPEAADEGTPAGIRPYAEAIRTEGIDYRHLREEETMQVFRADRLPDGVFDTGDRDLSKRSSATLYVEETAAGPFVARRVINLEKPFRIPMIAKITKMTEDVHYERVDAVPRPTRMRMEFAADAMGKRQEGWVEISLSDYDCADEAIAD